VERSAQSQIWNVTPRLTACGGNDRIWQLDLVIVSLFAGEERGKLTISSAEA
jgi:hypothetical protein